MALSITITPGKVLAAGELVANAKLNQLGQPVADLGGLVDTSIMAPADYSGIEIAGPYFYGLDIGTDSVARVSLANPPASYVDGLTVAFKVAVTNTGAATLNVNSLGAQPVKKNGNLDLAAGDWKQGQIVVCRYQLDASVIAAGSVYSGGGSYTQAVTIGQLYTYMPGVNETNLVNGVQTLTSAGQFTATGATVTLHGTNSGSVTASVVPASNVWQMLSQLGNPPPVTNNYAVDTGTDSTARVAVNPAPVAYVDGLTVAFKVAVANTGACTLNVNNLGAKPVKKCGNLDLAAGDWKLNQIVECRYQLDGSTVPAATNYNGGGTYTLNTVIGQLYTWTKGVNDTNLVNGVQTLVATGQFTATATTVTLNGTVGAGITATVVPASNVWQMLSQIGNPPVTPVDSHLEVLKSFYFS